MPNTYDQLADPNSRQITTTWDLDDHAAEGRAVLTLQTRATQRRDGKHLATSLYVQHRHPLGYLTRSFVIFERSAGAGIILALDPLPRFNGRKALAQHDLVLANLGGALDLNGADHPAYPELRRLLDLALASV